MKTQLKKGDTVIVKSGDDTRYTVLAVYGNGNIICKYKDSVTHKYREISIPVVAIEPYPRQPQRVRTSYTLYLKPACTN